MDLKQKFKSLFDIVKNKREELNFPSRNEDIAVFIGYTRPYFTTLLSGQRSVKPEHLRTLIAFYPLLIKYPVLDEEKMYENITSTITVDQTEEEFMRDVSLGNFHLNLSAIAAVVRTNQEELAHVRAVLEKRDPKILFQASRKKAFALFEAYGKVGIHLNDGK